MRKQLFYLSLTIVAIALSACSGGKKGVFGATSSGREIGRASCRERV